MSIYSGFATRQLQQTYDHCLNSLLYILQKRILKFYTNQKTDQYKFSNLVQKMYLQMRHLQKSKYLDPKCSYAVTQLFEYLIKQNFSDHNATVQQNSVPEDNIKKQVQRKKPYESRNYQAVDYNQLVHKQKTYQVPIRSQKPSPNRDSNNLNSNKPNYSINKRNKFTKSSSASKNIGKIVTSKSKQKNQNQNVTLQHGKNLIRQRTPSTTHGSRLIRQNKIVPHKQKQQILYRNRNYSFNQGDQMISKKFIKNSARVQPQISNSFSLKQQNEIHDIIKDYIQKNKRLPSANPSSHNKTISQQNSKMTSMSNIKINSLPQDSKITQKQESKISKKSSGIRFENVSRQKNFISG